MRILRIVSASALSDLALQGPFYRIDCMKDKTLIENEKKNYSSVIVSWILIRYTRGRIKFNLKKNQPSMREILHATLMSKNMILAVIGTFSPTG